MFFIKSKEDLRKVLTMFDEFVREVKELIHDIYVHINKPFVLEAVLEEFQDKWVDVLERKGGKK